MLESVISSKSFPLIVLSFLSFVLLQKLIDNQKSQNDNTQPKPRLV